MRHSDHTGEIATNSVNLLGFSVAIISHTVFPSGAYVTEAAMMPIYDEAKQAEIVPEFEYRRGPKPLPFDMTLKRNRRRYK